MKFRHSIIPAGLALALAGSLTFAAVPPTAAFADPASELAEAEEQLDSLGAELAAFQADLEDATTQLENKDYEISEKQAEIDDKQVELEQRQAELGLTLRTNYKAGSSSLLESILGSTSFEDLANRVYYASCISEHETELVETVRTLAAQLEQEMDELEQQKTELQQQVDDLQSKVDTYETKVAEAQELYDSLDAEVKAQLAAQQEAEENANISTVIEATGNSSSQSQSDDNESSSSEETSSNSSGGSTGGSTGSSTGGSTTHAPSGGGVETALSLVGSPYVWGATGPDSFDCSGLVCYCYGYARGRTTYDMINSLKASGDWKTSLDELSYGDLVFPHSGHVGIYLGNGQMVHASSPGVGVVIGPVYSFYGGGTY